MHALKEGATILKCMYPNLKLRRNNNDANILEHFEWSAYH